MAKLGTPVQALFFCFIAIVLIVLLIENNVIHLQSFVSSFMFASDLRPLLYDVQQLPVYPERVWSPPRQFDPELDKVLIYADELLPSLKSRVLDKNCSEDAKIVIFICSALGNVNQRLVIRETWGREAAKFEVKIYFALGSSSDAVLMQRVHEEDSVHQDIVVWPFIDTYNNFTIKVLSGLSWAHESCPRASFIVKTDDDIYLDLKILSKGLLEQESDLRWKNSVLGFELWPPEFKRDPKDTHYVPESVHSGYGAHYVVGYLEIYGRSGVGKLLDRTIKSLPALVLEDVFLTGFMAQEAELERWSLRPRLGHWSCSERDFSALHHKVAIGDHCQPEDMRWIHSAKMLA